MQDTNIYKPFKSSVKNEWAGRHYRLATAFAHVFVGRNPSSMITRFSKKDTLKHSNQCASISLGCNKKARIHTCFLSDKAREVLPYSATCCYKHISWTLALKDESRIFDFCVLSVIGIICLVSLLGETFTFYGLVNIDSPLSILCSPQCELHTMFKNVHWLNLERWRK